MYGGRVPAIRCRLQKRRRVSTNNKKEMTDRLPIRFLSHLSQLTSLLKGSGALTVVNSDALIRRHRSCFGGEVFDFSIRMATLVLLNSRVKFRRSVIGPLPSRSHL